jgi:hypothetical protein
MIDNNGSRSELNSYSPPEDKRVVITSIGIGNNGVAKIEDEDISDEEIFYKTINQDRLDKLKIEFPVKRKMFKTPVVITGRNIVKMNKNLKNHGKDFRNI